MDREAWQAAVRGVAKSRHDWVAKLNWTTQTIDTVNKQITNENLLYSTGNSSLLCGELNEQEIQIGGVVCVYI